MSTYTKGPHTYAPHMTEFYGEIRVTADDHTKYHRHIHIATIQNNLQHPGEAEANAKLYSAAPELLEALQKIVNWELPETDKFWDRDKKEPMSYEAAYGSNGARDYIKSIARAAIKKATT